MLGKYIIRLDDACPTMDSKNWHKMEDLLNKYSINPIVAVVPDNQDKNLMVDQEDVDFWNKVKKWQENSWDIALHGYEHLYTTKEAGLVPINERSEFAGLPYEIQKEKIKNGLDIFNKHDIACNIWVAPGHSFDENTIKALKNVTDIKIISDGIAFSSYWDYGMYWLPQQLWRPRKMPLGIWTVCFHPDTMNEKQFENLSNFIQNNKDSFVSVNSLEFTTRKKNIFEKVFEAAYWKMMKIKKDR